MELTVLTFGMWLLFRDCCSWMLLILFRVLEDYRERVWVLMNWMKGIPRMVWSDDDCRRLFCTVSMLFEGREWCIRCKRKLESCQYRHALSYRVVHQSLCSLHLFDSQWVSEETGSTSRVKRQWLWVIGWVAGMREEALLGSSEWV